MPGLRQSPAGRGIGGRGPAQRPAHPGNWPDSGRLRQIGSLHPGGSTNQDGAAGCFELPIRSSHGITLEQRIDAPAATVAGGPDLLHQVVTNLLVNADHAMRDSGGTLVVHVGVEEHTLAAADLSAGNYAYLEVEDTGHGMDAITASRVFEPFFTTRPVGHGTGLGLSVVHGIVKSMSGAIRVESTVGCGSKFRVLLPLIEAAARAPDRKFA